MCTCHFSLDMGSRFKMQNVDKSHLRNLFLMNCFIRKLKMVTNLFDQRRKKRTYKWQAHIFYKLGNQCPSTACSLASPKKIVTSVDSSKGVKIADHPPFHLYIVLPTHLASALCILFRDIHNVLTKLFASSRSPSTNIWTIKIVKYIGTLNKQKVLCKTIWQKPGLHVYLGLKIKLEKLMRIE